MLLLGSKKVSKPALGVPDDNQLWLSMIKRISMLEKQNLSQSRELIEKEKQIKVCFFLQSIIYQCIRTVSKVVSCL